MVEKTRVGPFEIVSRIGSSRRHRVYHARQVEQQRDVALKFIRLPPDVDRERALGRIQREARILKKLRHPNLVTVYGAGVADDQIFFACDLIKGESLTTLLGRRGKIAADLAVEIARQVASAISYLHENEIVHGKLTPDKIMIDPSNRVYVLDVRLNRSRRRSADTASRNDINAAAYMAPEQFNEGANEKSDLYALGAILFEMLTGRLHVEPESLARLYHQKMTAAPPSVASVALDCPIWLDRLIASLLDANEANRPHTALAVYYALEEIRKVDRNQTSVVDQMTSGFNALTAGADKTEAKRLLGQIDELDKRVPFYQHAWFQAIVLCAVIAAIAYGAWPVSSESLYTRGTEFMISNRFINLIKAEEHFQTVIRRQPRSELGRQAETKLYETRAKLLLMRAKSGNVGMERNTNRFADAFRMEQIGKYDQAKIIYEDLVQSLSDTGPFRHIVWESRKRIPEMERLIERRDSGDASSDVLPQDAPPDTEEDATVPNAIPSGK